jgi:3-methyladenine DNA glycosylase/8-oxoguanine DNA glycosylase
MAASASPPTPDAVGHWAATYDVDIATVLGPFVRGRRDPTIRLGADQDAWLTMRTTAGPASLHLRAEGQSVASAAWGQGATCAIESIADLLGGRDDDAGFPAELLPDQLRPVWTQLRRRWRVPRSGRVMEALVPAVLEQKVTGVESRRAWTALLRSRGEPAPGPTPEGMNVFPDIGAIARIPSWQWHRWGVQPQQSATIMRATQVAGRLEQCGDLELAAARRRLGAVDGIGPWTVAEVASRALGDPDAVSVGDYHLPGQLVFAFTGRMDGSEADMAELLEPFAGHRYRVQRLVEVSGITRPARGPRMTIADHRQH